MKVCFKDIGKDLLNIFFPANIKCILCSKELNSNTLYCLCDSCMHSLPFNTGKTCLRCDEPISSMTKYCINCKHNVPYYKHNKSVFLYEGAIKHLIRSFKYDNKKYYTDTLSNLLVSEYVKLNKDFDIIIPVPLHPKRYKMRGFNQSELLCKSFKEKLHLNVDTKSLIKVVYTESQTTLNRTEREKNLNGSFEVADKKAIKGKSILLVDDVFTTGSTINECARVLLKAGAKEVWSLTLAHAYINKNHKD